MPKSEISDYYGSGRYYPAADMLKLFLMPLIIFIYLGFPTRFGGYVSTYSNFAPLAIYILSGYFVLVPDGSKRHKKIKRALKKSARFTGLLFAAYFALDVVYLSYYETNWVPEVFRSRAFFEFLVFNRFPAKFPFGESLWCVVGLVYAYIFFKIAENTKLMKRPLILLSVSFAVSFALGELSALTGITYLGHDFVPACSVTAAIPGMLMGMVIRKYAQKILKIPKWVYFASFAAGGAIAFGELSLTSGFDNENTVGTLIGFWIMALSVCCFALSAPRMSRNFFSMHGKRHSRRIFAMFEIAAVVLDVFISRYLPDFNQFYSDFRGIVVFLVCFALACLISFVKSLIRQLGVFEKS